MADEVSSSSVEARLSALHLASEALEAIPAQPSAPPASAESASQVPQATLVSSAEPKRTLASRLSSAFAKKGASCGRRAFRPKEPPRHPQRHLSSELLSTTPSPPQLFSHPIKPPHFLNTFGSFFLPVDPEEIGDPCGLELEGEHHL